MNLRINISVKDMSKQWPYMTYQKFKFYAKFYVPSAFVQRSHCRMNMHDEWL